MYIIKITLRFSFSYVMDLRLAHPFTSIVAGPTSCGKSVFVERMIRSGLKIFNTSFDEIIWCYSDWHPELHDVKTKVKFQKGLDNLNKKNYNPRLVVIDDLMRESGATVVDMFTKGSHHNDTSVIFITQNVFHQGKGQRDISLNSMYMVIFKNPRDCAQISHLARQMFPSDAKFIQEAYKDATSRAHGYLFLDLKQSTPDHCRVRTNILGEEFPGYTVVYVPKSNNFAN